jgi:hypothetical protein
MLTRWSMSLRAFPVSSSAEVGCDSSTYSTSYDWSYVDFIFLFPILNYLLRMIIFHRPTSDEWTKWERWNVLQPNVCEVDHRIAAIILSILYVI